MQSSASTAAADVLYQQSELGPVRTWRAQLWRFARKKPLGAISAAILAALVMIAVSAPLLAPYDPIKSQDASRRLHAPSAHYLMGTDNLGRDIFSRVLYGARISLYVGFFAVGIGSVTGAAIGVFSGYTGGAVDLTIQRFVDVLQGFPFIVLALILIVALGASLTNVAIALTIAVIPGVIRLSRSSALSLREELFVLAAVAIGASAPRVVFRHIVPNALGPVFVLATGALGGVIVAEAGLSFLGLGVPPPNPSWGGMLNVAARGYLERAPWMAVYPGLALSIVVFSFSMLGDALRDVLDPRMRGSDTRSSPRRK